MGAHGNPVGVVDGWEIRNARCSRIENARSRKHGDLVNEGVWRWYMYGGVHGAGFYEL